METVQQILEPQQDAIIRLAKLTAKLEGENKAEATDSMPWELQKGRRAAA